MVNGQELYSCLSATATGTGVSIRRESFRFEDPQLSVGAFVVRAHPFWVVAVDRVVAVEVHLKMGLAEFLAFLRRRSAEAQTSSSVFLSPFRPGLAVASLASRTKRPVWFLEEEVGRVRKVEPAGGACLHLERLPRLAKHAIIRMILPRMLLLEHAADVRQVRLHHHE